MIEIVAILGIFSILMPYLFPFCFPSLLAFYCILAFFYDFSLWLCENGNPWNLFLFNLISLHLSHLSTSLSYLNTGVMSPFCFPHHHAPCGLGLSPLQILIYYSIEFKTPLIIKRKKKRCCQTNCHMPSLIRQISISEMLKCEKQICIVESLKLGFRIHLTWNQTTVLWRSPSQNTAFHEGQRNSGT